MQDPKLCTWEHVLDHDAAALMWDCWKQNPEKCPYMNTNKNGTFYVRVPTAITINFQSTVMRENSVEALMHKFKNATPEDLSKHVGRLQMDLGSFGNMGGIDIDGFGQRMLSNGGPKIGQDMGAMLGKVTSLVKPSEQTEETDDEAEGAQDGEGNGLPEPSHKKMKTGHPGEANPLASPNKSKWWNKAAFQVARETDINEMITTMHSELLSAHGALKTTIEDVRVFDLSYLVLTF